MNCWGISIRQPEFGIKRLLRVKGMDALGIQKTKFAFKTNLRQMDCPLFY